MSLATLVTEIVDGRRVQYYQYPEAVDTMTVEPTVPNWGLTNIEAAFHNAALTDDVPTQETPVEVVEDEAEDLLEDLIVESVQVVADKIRAEESNRLISADENALRFAEQQASMLNPWEIFLGHAKRFLGKPSADRGLEYLLNQTYLEEHQLGMSPELPNLSVYLRRIVQDFLSGYDDRRGRSLNSSTSRKFAEAKELEGSLKGIRPADIYRAYARPLRWLCNHGFQHLVGATLRRLLLDQTMPECELDNPDWIEPYSGDLDPEPVEYINIRVKGDVDEVEAQSAMSSESFNSEDGLDVDDATLSQAEKAWAEIDTDEIVKDFGWQSEITVTEHLPDLRRAMGAVTRNLRTDLDVLATAAKMADFDTLEEQNAWISRRMRTKDSFKDFWLELKAQALGTEAQVELDKQIRIAQANLDKDPESIELKNRLHDLVTTQIFGAAPQDLTAVSLEFQNEMCYPEEMFDHIPLVPARGGCINLGQWLNLFGEEMIESLLNRDPGMSMAEPPLEFIEQFVEETVEGLVTAQTDQTGKDITRTPVYLKAYYTAVLNSKDLVVDGRNVAVEAGWDAWREAKSPAGNRAYKAELKNGKPPKEAMRAFWSVVNGGQVRSIQLDRVVTIAGDKSGLVLASGRRVTWRIALMKHQQNELELDADTRQRLKAVLIKMGIGLEFARAL